MEDSATDGTPPRCSPGRRAWLPAACALALCVACATPPPAPKGPLLLHPLPPAAKDYALVQGAIVYTGPGFSVTARPWDYRLVAAEIARSGEPNPFGAGEEDTGNFLFVRLLLENRSGKSLVFNPMRATLSGETIAPVIPVENADLVAFAGEEAAAAEALARSFRRRCFDLTVTVPAGGALERYLVFPAPKERPGKPIALKLEDLWLGSTSFDLLFPLEAY